MNQKSLDKTKQQTISEGKGIKERKSNHLYSHIKCDFYTFVRNFKIQIFKLSKWKYTRENCYYQLRNIPYKYVGEGNVQINEEDFKNRCLKIISIKTKNEPNRRTN